jgi:endonuclease/exonuclease/phosphatase (EEP) superfamily protein YafD
MTARFTTMSLSTASVERTAPTVPTAVRVALWLAVAGCAAWALVRVLGLDRFAGPLVPPISFTPYVVVCALVVLVVAVALRAWLPAAVAGLAAVALVACVLPRCLPDGGGATRGPRLRVLSSNMKIGAADAASITELVRRHDVDLLAVQEFTPEAERALDAAGLPDLLPYRVSYPQPGAWGSGVFSRYPLRDDGLRTQKSGFTQARATVQVPDGPAVAFESAHPCPPTPPACSAMDLAAEPPAGTDGTVRILAGDMNSTLDHANLRRLIATGYRDAADVRGQGLTPTWPFDGTRLPPVTIDHVLADRRVGVARFAAHTVPGTDHRAIYAELVLPRS